MAAVLVSIRSLLQKTREKKLVTNLSPWWQVCHCNVVQAFETRRGSVEFDNDLDSFVSARLHPQSADEVTLSAIWMISGEAPTLAPGIMPPSSVMAEASTIATSNLLFALCMV